ncbi:M20 family metallo-hydrolase [Paenibacillus pasadenensis]|uniref:M20 family metallo-hydrolase n=1 Tax=Paenibacillus pasadenensis TaxID=217090 RepID=UPI00203F1F42|nr:M20 family metallo-hydrolase [Paenibacillus pasadenensis]MCM3745825.1 M20 family metallo-hydrolase [Paenibacillus pasadenensis]
MSASDRAINMDRVMKRIERLAEIGKISDTGVNRQAMTPLDRQAVELAGEWMKEAGMSVRLDEAGNLIGRLNSAAAPDAPVLMLGSHLDTQPYAGRFDGIIGVLGAIEAVQAFTDRGFRPLQPIEVVAFTDEEGCRFNKGLFGSRAMTGRLEQGELDRTDADGITRREALAGFGGDPNRLQEAEYAKGAIDCYLELHIEQGPVLESLGASCGLVTGISGPLWLTVDLYGFAGHAGSVPMAMRRDALAGAAQVITGFQAMVRAEAGTPVVGTVGTLQLFPGSRNIIPERVQFTVDLRDLDMERRDRLEEGLRKLVDDAAADNKLSYFIREDTNSPPRFCDESLMNAIRGEALSMGLKLPELMSGPFHDALALSYVCPYAMIFVRSKDGISHNPMEFSLEDDIGDGVELLYRTMKSLALANKGERSGG